MVLHQTAAAGQCAFSEFRHHEYFISNIVLGSKPFRTRRHKAEPRVKLWMPKHDDDLLAEPPALFQALVNKLRADSFSLVFRQYCHRRKPYRSECTGFRFNGHRAKEDVPNHLLIDNRDKRNIRLSVSSKRVDKISFIAPAKGKFVNTPDEAVIFQCFRANENHNDQQEPS